MTTLLNETLNAAQASIYSRTNIRRAFQDFDDADISGIYLRDANVVVGRTDGTEQVYNRALIKQAHLDYTFRLKDFFSYLGANYRGPSIWHNNAYVIFKGWNYNHSLGHLTASARLQATWADKFIHIKNKTRLETLLQSDQTDLGHLIAPDGWRAESQPVDMESEFGEESNGSGVQTLAPYCSCGSFTRQLNNLADFQAEIEGYKPWCIHLTWFNKYRELLAKRTAVRNSARGGVSEKCVAWVYAPPSDAVNNGRMVLLHTQSGSMAPLTHWRTYKPRTLFTQHDAWDLFDNMMEAGYVPFPLTSLPQLQGFLKK
jgi:hypothetical protein